MSTSRSFSSRWSFLCHTENNLEFVVTFFADFDSANLDRVERYKTDEKESASRKALSSASTRTHQSASMLVDSEDEGDSSLSRRISSVVSSSTNCSLPEIDREDPHILEFSLYTRHDAHGTEFQTGHRTWFYFGVYGVPPGVSLSFRLENLNRQERLYGQGYRPFYLSFPFEKHWKREGSSVRHEMNKSRDKFLVEFTHEFTHPDIIDSSFGKRVYDEARYQSILRSTGPSPSEPHHPCILPSSVSLLRRIAFEDSNLSAGIGCCPTHPESLSPLNARDYENSLNEIPLHSVTYFSFCPPHSFADTQRKLEALDQLLCNHDSIYFHRECLTESLCGRRIDLLTISSMNLRLDSRRPPLPLTHSQYRDTERAFQFDVRKPIVFISSRVHPGETPASHVFNSFLDFLLDDVDPRASVLRDTFVFLLVPHLNPDGVSLGHYRVDTRGVNLNRMYTGTDALQHPSIFAVKELLLQISSIMQLEFYIDLHAHASKTGTFVFGNFLEFDDQVRNVMFAKLLAINSPVFDFDACDFSEKGMKSKDKDGESKEGAGRVAVYRLTGVTHCYTLECNYNYGSRDHPVHQIEVQKRINLSFSDEPMEPVVIKSPRKQYIAPIFYDQEAYESVGHGIATSLLDIVEKNPLSRISSVVSADGKDLFASIQDLRRWVKAYIRQNGGSKPNFRVPRAARNSSNESSSSTKVAIHSSASAQILSSANRTVEEEDQGPSQIKHSVSMTKLSSSSSTKSANYSVKSRFLADAEARADLMKKDRIELQSKRSKLRDQAVRLNSRSSSSASMMWKSEHGNSHRQQYSCSDSSAAGSSNSDIESSLGPYASFSGLDTLVSNEENDPHLSASGNYSMTRATSCVLDGHIPLTRVDSSNSSHRSQPHSTHRRIIRSRRIPRDESTTLRERMLNVDALTRQLHSAAFESEIGSRTPYTASSKNVQPLEHVTKDTKNLSIGNEKFHDSSSRSLTSSESGSSLTLSSVKLSPRVITMSLNSDSSRRPSSSSPTPPPPHIFSNSRSRIPSLRSSNPAAPPNRPPQPSRSASLVSSTILKK